MRARWCFVAVVTLSPLAADAQTTADGVQAIVRADYAAAARILTPLAENAADPDPIAQFFMASLYESGRGVTPNLARACGLYLSATRAPHPFQSQSLTLAEAMGRKYPPDLCDVASLRWQFPRAAPVTLGQQTKAADGVDAFLRADYQQAAEILKPLAESWPSRDHVAEFFMAALYDGNHGLPADQMRACALYSRAADDRSNPLGPQAEMFLEAFSRSMSADAQRECLTLAAVGFAHGIQPVTFSLEPGHWVSIDFQGATVSYNGKEAREDLSIDNGSIRLTTEHTELTVGGSTPQRRHFIEFFAWTPIENTWQLGWDVYEVVRDVFVRVAGGELMRIERPPTEGVDIRSLAQLRVNEQGRAEWAILGGPDKEYGLIATEEEKRQHEGQRIARKAAEAKTDWSKVFDVKRPPTLAYLDGDGCGNIFLFGWSQNRAEIITLEADKDILGLSTTPRTFNLATPPNDLVLLVHIYDRPIARWPFCTDVFVEPKPLSQIWRAVGGTATIEISAPGVSPFAPLFAYRATVRIVGAEFVSESGVRVRQVQPITLTGLVGFL